MHDSCKFSHRAASILRGGGGEVTRVSVLGLLWTFQKHFRVDPVDRYWDYHTSCISDLGAALFLG